MSYVAVEANVETMLKTAIASALSTAGLSATVYGWWLADGSAATEPETFPQVNIKAQPNVPDGWQQPLRMVPVTIDCITFAPDDPKRTACVALYNCVRNLFDTTHWTSVVFDHVPAITIEPGGECIADGRICLISLELTVQVCLGEQ